MKNSVKKYKLTKVWNEFQFGIKIAKCKPHRMPTNLLDNELDSIKYKMKSDDVYRYKMTQMAANFSDPSFFFSPR